MYTVKVAVFLENKQKMQTMSLPITDLSKAKSCVEYLAKELLYLHPFASSVRADVMTGNGRIRLVRSDSKQPVDVSRHVDSRIYRVTENKEIVEIGRIVESMSHPEYHQDVL